MKKSTLPTNFTVLSLSNNPHYLNPLTDQQWQVWGYDERADLLEFFEQEFQEATPKAMPRTWLLIDITKPFPTHLTGAVTLSLDEMGDTQPKERNPWLGYLYIDHEYRGQGLAKYLTEFAVTQAHEMGFENVYLYASDETARYQHWGWQILQTLDFQGEEVNVMCVSN